MEKNKTRRKLYVREYNEKTKEFRKERDAKRRRESPLTPEQKANKKAYMKAWHAKNPNKKQEAFGRRKAIKKGAPVGCIAEIRAWFKRWKSLKFVICYWCMRKFSPKKCQGDHIIPLAKSGPHTIENLCIACEDCNRHKHDKTLDRWNSELSSPVLF